MTSEAVVRSVSPTLQVGGGSNLSNPTKKDEVATQPKTTKKYPTTPAMHKWAAAHLELLAEGSVPSYAETARLAGVHVQTYYRFKERYTWWDDYLKDVTQSMNPSVYGALALTASDPTHAGQIPAARLYLQAINGWSEKQDVVHTHTGEVLLSAGESEVAHRIAAARQLREERDARDEEGLVIEAKATVVKE